MTDPMTAEEARAVERSMTLGTQRDPLRLPERLTRTETAPELVALAFLAHQRRMTAAPLAHASALTLYEAPEDPRPPLQGSLRHSFRRLAASAELRRTPRPLTALAWALRDRGLRLHPFDVARALPTEALSSLWGPFEAWLSAQLSAGEKPGSVAATDDENWLTLTPALRVQWLARRRAHDADAARSLIQAVWSQEKSEMRLRYLETMAVGLGASDLEFLRSLQKDRSTKVKQAAEALLHRIPEAVDAQERLEALAQGLTLEGAVRKSLGVARGHKSKLHVLGHWLSQTDPVALAAEMGTSPEVLCRPAPALQALLPDLTLAVIRFERFELLDAIVRSAAKLGVPGVDAQWLGLLPTLQDGQRRLVIEKVLDTSFPIDIVAHAEWVDRWIDIVGGPFPDPVSKRMRSSMPFRALLGAIEDPETREKAEDAVNRLVVLVPPSDAAEAAGQLSDCSGAAVARQTLELLAAVAEAHPIDEDTRD